MHRYDGGYKLSVSDNGIGFPEDLDYRNTDTLGMLIVNSLTEQIDGELSLDRSKGTKFTVNIQRKRILKF